jgi:ribosome maturation factor RimP
VKPEEGSSLSDTTWMMELEKICENACQQTQCYLYELELVGIGAGRTLRIFIDKEAESGAGVDDCTQVSRLLNEVLDTNDLIPGGAYMLEVSTPGVERVLRRKWHFEKAVGRKIWLKTRVPMEQLGVHEPSLMKAKQAEAVLKAATAEFVELESKKAAFKLPYDSIEKAHTVFEMMKKVKP